MQKATWSFSNLKSPLPVFLIFKILNIFDIVIMVRSSILVDSHLNVSPLLLRKVYLHHTQLTRTLNQIKARGKLSKDRRDRWASANATQQHLTFRRHGSLLHYNCVSGYGDTYLFSLVKVSWLIFWRFISPEIWVTFSILSVYREFNLCYLA